MVDKLKEIFDARQSPEESEQTVKELGQEAKSFQFLCPRIFVPSSYPSTPSKPQGCGDPHLKNKREISSMLRSAKSADAIISVADASLCRDVNLSALKAPKNSDIPYQETVLSRKCHDNIDVNFVNTNLMPFVETKAPRSALDLHNPMESLPSHPGKPLKEREQFPLDDANGTLEEFQGEKMESGARAYARRETNDSDHVMKCEGGQLHQSIVMQTHENGLTAENHLKKESAKFDASLKFRISGSADIVGPKCVGRTSTNTRSLSCTGMKSDCSFLTGVIEERAVMSAPCHSMCMHNIQRRFRQTYQEDKTSTRGELDKVFDDGYVRASSVHHTQTISAIGSSSLPSIQERLIDNCTSEIFNLAGRPFNLQYESKIEGGSRCGLQRVPKSTQKGFPDQTFLRSSNCSRVEKYYVLESINRINSLGKNGELQEKALLSDCGKTSGSRSIGNKSSSSVPPNQGSSDAIAQRGLFPQELEKKVDFGGCKEEKHITSCTSKENGCTINTETENSDINKRKRPLFSDVFLEGKEQILSETDSLCAEYIICQMNPQTLDNEDMTRIKTSELSSRWVKRLKLCSMDSFALGTNCFSIDSSPNRGQVQKLFTRVLNYSRSSSNIHWDKESEQKKTGKSMAFLVNGRESPVELLKRSSPWIRRWCRTSHELIHPRLASGRREAEVPSLQRLDEEKQLPSIGAMALMGKAVTNFRPCEFRRSGPFVVWNTNGMLQE